jgi:signal transduction histidine kinase/ActR/RegA family two-component response regulator
MNQTAETIQKVIDRQFTKGLQRLSIAGFVMLLASLSKAFIVGWQPVMYVYIALFAAFTWLAFFGVRLDFAVRVFMVAAITFILGVGSLLTWGFGGVGPVALFVCCVTVTMFFGGRIGTFVTILCALIVAAIGLLVVSKTVGLSVDPRLSAISYASWLITLCGMGLVGGLVIRLLGVMNQKIQDLAFALERRNAELSQTMTQLESEVQERGRAEAEQRVLEERLQRAKRMEDLGTLAGGVAHDLNNILVGAVSYPDLLLARLPADSPLRGSIETIRQSGMKAAAIVQDLLALARRGVGTRKIVNLNSIVLEYLASPECEKLLSFHPQIKIETDLGPRLANLSGSQVHLFKVVMNLVSNAAEAMPEGGRIVVSTRNSRTDQYAGSFEIIEAGNYTVLEVSDTGTGIRAEDLGHIFEPFFTKKTMGRSGTGLGMAVVWGTVKDHDGFIDVKSTIGQGTTFTIYLPSTTEAAATAQQQPSLQRARRGESILIIDDVKEQREVVSRMFVELGYSVAAVSSGEEALSFLRERPVDLLFLDMCMEPKMDGLDTYREALKIRPGQKALITSGYSETDRVKEAQELGAGPCIRKPFLLNTIAVAIRAELDRQPGPLRG